MRRIRIGNDIILRIRLTRRGGAENLEGKKIGLMLRNILGSVSLPVVQSGEELIAGWQGTQQQWTGAYTVTLTEDWGENNRNTVDEACAFELVSISSDEGVETGTVNIELDMDISVPGNGLSAYEIAVMHGFVGSEKDWIDKIENKAHGYYPYTENGTEVSPNYVPTAGEVVFLGVWSGKMTMVVGDGENTIESLDEKSKEKASIDEITDLSYKARGIGDSIIVAVPETYETEPGLKLSGLNRNDVYSAGDNGFLGGEVALPGYIIPILNENLKRSMFLDYMTLKNVSEGGTFPYDFGAFVGICKDRSMNEAGMPLYNVVAIHGPSERGPFVNSNDYLHTFIRFPILNRKETVATVEPYRIQFGYYQKQQNKTPAGLPDEYVVELSFKNCKNEYGVVGGGVPQWSSTFSYDGKSDEDILLGGGGTMPVRDLNRRHVLPLLWISKTLSHEIAHGENAGDDFDGVCAEFIGTSAGYAFYAYKSETGKLYSEWNRTGFWDSPDAYDTGYHNRLFYSVQDKMAYWCTEGHDDGLGMSRGFYPVSAPYTRRVSVGERFTESEYGSIMPDNAMKAVSYAWEQGLLYVYKSSDTIIEWIEKGVFTDRICEVRFSGFLKYSIEDIWRTEDDENESVDEKLNYVLKAICNKESYSDKKATETNPPHYECVLMPNDYVGKHYGKIGDNGSWEGDGYTGTTYIFHTKGRTFRATNNKTICYPLKGWSDDTAILYNGNPKDAPLTAIFSSGFFALDFSRLPLTYVSFYSGSGGASYSHVNNGLQAMIESTSAEIQSELDYREWVEGSHIKEGISQNNTSFNGGRLAGTHYGGHLRIFASKLFSDIPSGSHYVPLLLMPNLTSVEIIGDNPDGLYETPSGIYALVACCPNLQKLKLRNMRITCPLFTYMSVDKIRVDITGCEIAEDAMHHTFDMTTQGLSGIETIDMSKCSVLPSMFTNRAQCAGGIIDCSTWDLSKVISIDKDWLVSENYVEQYAADWIVLGEGFFRMGAPLPFDDKKFSPSWLRYMASVAPQVQQGDCHYVNLNEEVIESNSLGDVVNILETKGYKTYRSENFAEFGLDAYSLSSDSISADFNGIDDIARTNPMRFNLSRAMLNSKMNPLSFSISLTASQVRGTWGEDVELWRLYGIEGGKIRFDKVDLSTDTSEAVSIGEAYIITVGASAVPDVENNSEYRFLCDIPGNGYTRIGYEYGAVWHIEGVSRTGTVASLAAEKQGTYTDGAVTREYTTAEGTLKCVSVMYHPEYAPAKSYVMSGGTMYHLPSNWTSLKGTEWYLETDVALSGVTLHTDDTEAVTLSDNDTLSIIEGMPE